MSVHPAPHILVFDSGLGGISIYDAIRSTFPGARLTYCSDNEAFPYGEKTETALLSRVSQVLLRLMETVKPDLLVIACNTASTVALPKIRSLISQPVIGVVPAIKPAATITQTPYVGLLATPGTIQRAYTQNLIDQFGKNLRWIKVGSSELVQLAEQKMYGSPPSAAAIAQTVKALKQYTPEQLDTVVLGCTHFPLLKTELQETLPQIQHWVDSSEAIANRVGFWLHELGFSSASSPSSSSAHHILFTRKLEEEGKLQSLLKERQFSKLSYLENI